MWIILYTGKGGVGKTSAAAATGLRAADLGITTRGASNLLERRWQLAEKQRFSEDGSSSPVREALTRMHHHSSPCRTILPLILLAASLLALSCGGNTSATSGPAIPGAGQSPWVQDRIAALNAIYGFTPQGQRFLEELDLRQMTGQPGWFGSFGYQGWTGVGEAKPASITHELGHAYWGAFAVSGRPDLNWNIPRSGSPSSVMSQYHRDLITFMGQPPDPYEPLRERLRNVPQVILGESSPLIHFGEADLVHTIGGNLQLLPPLLRKYYDQYLPRGLFDSWYSALEWYLGLSPEDTRAAGAYFGLNHLHLSLYRELEPLEKTALPQGVRETVAAEEKQRLGDFARQFDIITGVEELDGDLFSLDLFFFRGYLRDKLALYKRHPEALADLEKELPIAADSMRVMEVFVSLDGKPLEDRADILGQHLVEPFFSNFWPLVDSGLLMELYGRGMFPLDTEPLARTTDEGIERLGSIVAEASAILSLARIDLSAGAGDLAEVIREALEEDRAEVGLIIELLRAADAETADAMGRELDDDLIRKLLDEASGTLRQLLGPDDLLPFLGITSDASVDEMVRGVQDLLQGSSGNFRIDQPYFSTVYELLARRGESRPREALDIPRRSGLFPEGLIREHPQEAVAILSSDLEQAASLVAGVEGHGRNPQGLVHSIISVDPTLAADLVSRLDSINPSAVQEALVYFAYDSYRKARLPSLEVSLQKDGVFLLALADLRSDQWVIERMGRAVATYDGYAKEGIVPPGFLREYRKTLEEAAGLLDGPEASPSSDESASARLRDLAEAAFSQAGLDY